MWSCATLLTVQRKLRVGPSSPRTTLPRCPLANGQRKHSLVARVDRQCQPRVVVSFQGTGIHPFHQVEDANAPVCSERIMTVRVAVPPPLDGTIVSAADMTLEHAQSINSHTFMSCPVPVRGWTRFPALSNI